ncbi:TetR/AcrR family transcriptional regulator [Heyndrickxia sp. MSNUG]|uniref:TetR/AcrR family transcriptional regulator n=1 Tax=Heyndrickxia sp. MSNUG TaxID=3136677 RepID=UPI003C300116
MNDRKQHVIDKARDLFIEKGFQATSLQEILEYSGISKGTFYNYFSSKNELLIAIFKNTFQKIEKERQELITGKDPSDPEILVKQIEIQMRTNRENNLIPLYEEVFFSNDKELKKFLEIGQMKTLRWGYERFKDLFDESLHPYLLDATIMLKGMLQQNIRYYVMAHGTSANLLPVVRYSVNRIMKMVAEAGEAREQLISPEILEKWLPTSRTEDLELRKNLYCVISKLKKLDCKQTDYIEKLDFIKDELLKSKAPRKFLIDSVLSSLDYVGETELSGLKKLVENKFS